MDFMEREEVAKLHSVNFVETHVEEARAGGKTKKSAMAPFEMRQADAAAVQCAAHAGWQRCQQTQALRWGKPQNNTRAFIMG